MIFKVIEDRTVNELLSHGQPIVTSHRERWEVEKIFNTLGTSADLATL